MGWGLNQYELVKILVKRACKGYYLRWWFNGENYWFFLPGRVSMSTEGQDYRTIGTKKLSLGSGQVTRNQMQAIRTIMFSRDIQLYGIAGWSNVRIEPGSFNIYDNKIGGAEIEFVAIVGSKDISYSTGYSPVSGDSDYTPPGGDQTFFADQIIFGFIYSQYGIGESQTCHLTISPDKDFSMVLTGLSWCTVIALQSSNEVLFYPNTENTGARRDGVVTLTIPGKSPIYLSITQFEVGIGQIFEADDTDHDFIWDEFGPGIAKQSILTIVPDQAFTQDNDIGAWATVTLDQAANRMTCYPNAKNDGVELNGTIHLHCPDAADIDVTVTHFGIPIPDPPVATAGTGITSASFWANWNASGLASGYYLDVSKVINFASYVAGYQNLDVGNVLAKQVTGLEGGTDYYFRVRAYNVNGTSVNSNTIKTTTIADSIDLSIYLITFDYLENCCTVCIITVDSSGPWTSGWVFGGVYFESDKYAGGDGEVCTITTVDENNDGWDYGDTLRFTCGTAQIDCEMVQLKFGDLCP